MKRWKYGIAIALLAALTVGGTTGCKRAKEKAKSTAQVAKQELQGAGQKAKAGAQQARQVVQPKLADATITTKIKAKLTADPEINPLRIDVDTRDGVVTLSGTVAKAAARSEAEKHARQTEGVTEVRNQLEVKSE